jgi:hypothetical protein
MRTEGRTTMNRTLRLATTLAVATGVASGCTSDLPVASELTATRILGARVEVAADPGRADVAPGEAANVEWIVAAPTDPGAFDWMFATCVGIDGACADTPGAPTTGTGQPVVVPFTTPAADALGGRRVPLMGGMLDGIVARFSIPVEADGAAPNRHPALANDEIDLDGAPWTTPAAGDAGGPCDGSDGTPVVHATPDGATAVDSVVRLVSDADDRDSYVTDPATGATALEELQISNFATAGKFTASYAAIFADDFRPNPDVTMKWEPPAARDVPAGGEIVHVYLVVRDGRGGLDWTSRALCAVR